MNLSDLQFRSEMKAPSIDQADASKLIDTEIKLAEYKTLFILTFGNPEIRLRDNELIILRCESFDNWKADYLSRKNKAMQIFNN